MRYSIETEYQNGEQDICVLLPDNYKKDRRYPVLYVLPVEKGFEQKFGYGLEILRQMNAHNVYDIIIVQMGFEKMPWFGDHADDPKTRQASYLKEYVVPFIENKYSTLGTLDGRLLFGFSKSGWGAFSLILFYPEFFGYASAWDSPMFPIGFNHDIQSVYGTLEQFALYRPDILIPRQKRFFQQKNRLVLTGENIWGNIAPAPHLGSHTAAAHQLLEKEGIKHYFDNSLNVPHCWNKLWMTPALQALMDLTRQNCNG